jgi:hypothetical protein
MFLFIYKNSYFVDSKQILRYRGVVGCIDCLSSWDGMTEDWPFAVIKHNKHVPSSVEAMICFSIA